MDFSVTKTISQNIPLVWTVLILLLAIITHSSKDIAYLIWWLFVSSLLLLLHRDIKKAKINKKGLTIDAHFDQKINSYLKNLSIVLMILSPAILVLPFLLQGFYYSDHASIYSFVDFPGLSLMLMIFLWVFLSYLFSYLLLRLRYSFSIWGSDAITLQFSKNFGKKSITILSVYLLLVEFSLFGSYSIFYDDHFTYKSHLDLFENQYTYEDITSIGTKTWVGSEDSFPIAQCTDITQYYVIRLKDGRELMTCHGGNGLQMLQLGKEYNYPNFAQFLSEKSGIIIDDGRNSQTW